MLTTYARIALLTASAAAWVFPLSAQAQSDLRIRIPATSSMHLYAPDAYTGLVTFTGEQVLEGHLLARSEQIGLDGETDWQVSLTFVPDAGADALLPIVREAGEAEVGTRTIILQRFDGRAPDDWIGTVFGADVAARMGSEALVVARAGTATLRDYRTGIECDVRDHYAVLEAFVPGPLLDRRDTEALDAQRPGTCAR